MSRHYPFCLSTLPTVCAVSLALLMPASVSPLLAQAALQQSAQQAALSDRAKTENKAEKKPPAESALPQAAPAADHPCGGQPFLDHRRFGRRRLSC